MPCLEVNLKASYLRLLDLAELYGVEVYSVVDTEERFEFVVLNPNLVMHTFPFRTVLVAEAVDRVVEEFLDQSPSLYKSPSCEKE